MHLSDRMKMVVRMVSKGNRVADIGCDHAYLSIYLIRNSVSEHIIAMDINEGPLKRATENVRLYGCEDFIELRLSDGLSELKENEADTILIAGMGGELMTRILSGHEKLLLSTKELVLQPQADYQMVRRLLHSEGFAITDEDICFEDGKFYIAMQARKVGNSEQIVYNEADYRYGKILMEKRSPVFIEYLKTEKRKTDFIKQQLRTNKTKCAEERYPSFLAETEALNEALRICDVI